MKLSLSLRQRIECALILRNINEGSIEDWRIMEMGLEIFDIQESEAAELGINLKDLQNLDLSTLPTDEVEYEIPTSVFTFMQEKFMVADRARKIGRNIVPLAQKFLRTREQRRQEEKGK
jgi:hypothetical protein